MAADHLAIMASSVSSERAFSGAGLTITKLCSHLKSDIVEALQGLKAAMCTDFLEREPQPSSLLEEQILEEEDEEGWEDEEFDGIGADIALGLVSDGDEN